MLLALLLVVGTFGWSYVVLLPAFARDVFGLGAEGYGLLMSAAAVGSVTGALTVASVRDVRHGRRMAFLALAILAPSVVAFASVADLVPAAIALALTGFGLSAFFSSVNTLIQASVADDVRGRVMGVYTLVFGASMPLGAFQAGTLAHVIGAPATVRLGGVICAVAGIVAGVWAWRARDRSPPAPVA
jgi:predicted MFS family arabinose efflux permease